MVKELIIAIILGAVIGFGATSGIIALRNQNKEPLISPTPTAKADSLTPASEEQETHTLTITNPDNETVTDSDEIDIEGQSTAKSHIVIHTQKDSFFINADESGSFSQGVELEGGANLIQISSISPDEQQISMDLIVTYSTADF